MHIVDGSDNLLDTLHRAVRLQSLQLVYANDDELAAVEAAVARMRTSGLSALDITYSARV